MRASGQSLYDPVDRADTVGEYDDDSSSSQRTPLMPSSLDMAPEPKDRCSISYIIFYLLGLGSLLPWNFFITANDYWMYKLSDGNATIPASTTSPAVWAQTVTSPANVGRDSLTWPDVLDGGNVTATTPALVTTTKTSPTTNSLQSLFMNSLALCAMLPNVIFQFLNTILQKRIPQNVRFMTTLCIMIGLFILTEILVRVDTSDWQTAFFFVTLVTVVILNSCSAVFQSSVFGLAACFPQKFSGGVMAGQGIGGVFAALAMIMALASGGNPADSAFIFFLTAIAVLTLTMVLYCFLIKQKFYKYYTGILHADEQKNQELPLNVNGFADQEGDPCLQDIKFQPSINSVEKEDRNRPSTDILHVAKRIKLYMFCIVYTFFITLSCFPAVTAKIRSISSGTAWSDTYFNPVCCFLLFNLSDWIGRTSASYIHIPSPQSRALLFIFVLIRTVFPVLFMLCNAQPRDNLPVLFRQDSCFVVFMFLFGFSNGHLSTLCMQYGPKQVEPENAATAGSMLAFMISVGLLAGAGMSFVLTMLI